jgi:hypothetical protein
LKEENQFLNETYKLIVNTKENQGQGNSE